MPSVSEDFEQFWAVYPRRIGKLAARKAYIRARHHGSAEEILDGVENYKRHLPRELQYVKHASTWLNAGCWMDEYEVPVAVERRSCTHDPRCNSKVWCEVLRARERGEVA
jgi:hypothetical protein